MARFLPDRFPHDYRKAAISESDRTSPTPTGEQFFAMSSDSEFRELRSTFRGFAFPVTIAFLA
ncbi:DUF485 domain-containing protein [Corynebacterium belfantii]|uniref:DUF485 domain-containing protein n=1 Tax=Corynebacterium belfantii TaxID=2014537 RepID=UPI001F356CD5|nr:DUF485 domain-containing protein [Corynebacterium belfantii]